MNYQETLDYLFTSLPMYQRIGKAAYKANLDNTHALDAYFGHPHKDFKSVHIAGTNGKGSVSHLLAAVLQKHGYKTGLYTSPHLFDFRERIKINGQPIAQEKVVQFVADHKAFFETIHPSFFEMTVAMAFHIFKEEKVDIAIVETGMGGRLDSTNILSPLVSVITNIGLDHTQFLGHTLAEIAEEKAGIIKDKIPVVIGETQKETQFVFRHSAKKHKSPIDFADKKFNTEVVLQDFCTQSIKLGSELIKTDLTGNYQKKNLVTAFAVLDQLKTHFALNPTNTIEALARVKTDTGLRGRWDVMGHEPLMICETSHNAAGIKEMVNQLKSFTYKQLHLITGMVNDKDGDAILSLFPKEGRYYFTKANIARAMPEADLKKLAQKHALTGHSFPTVGEAIQAATSSAHKDDAIIITGSIFLIADALKYFDALKS